MPKKSWLDKQADLEVKNRLYGGSELKHNLRVFVRLIGYVFALGFAGIAALYLFSVAPDKTTLSTIEFVLIMAGIYGLVCIHLTSKNVDVIKRDIAEIKQKLEAERAS